MNQDISFIELQLFLKNILSDDLFCSICSNTPPPGMESNRTSVFICLELIGGSKTNFFCVTLLSVFDKCEISMALERVKQNYSFIEKKSQEGGLDQLGQKGL